MFINNLFDAMSMFAMSSIHLSFGQPDASAPNSLHDAPGGVDARKRFAVAVAFTGEQNWLK